MDSWLGPEKERVEQFGFTPKEPFLPAGDLPYIIPEGTEVLVKRNRDREW